MTNETNYDTVFGKMAVEHGLCTDDELRHSLEEMEARKEINPVILKDLMIELGFITSNQAERLKEDIKDTKAAVKKIPGYKITGKHTGRGGVFIVAPVNGKPETRPDALRKRTLPHL